MKKSTLNNSALKELKPDLSCAAVANARTNTHSELFWSYFNEIGAEKAECHLNNFNRAKSLENFTLWFCCHNRSWVLVWNIKILEDRDHTASMAICYSESSVVANIAGMFSYHVSDQRTGSSTRQALDSFKGCRQKNAYEYIKDLYQHNSKLISNDFEGSQ